MTMMPDDALPPLSKADVEAIRARADAAESPPWVVSTGARGFVPGQTIFAGSERGRVVLQTASLGASSEQFQADATFAAAARSDVPRLLSALEAAWTERDELLDVLGLLHVAYRDRDLYSVPWAEEQALAVLDRAGRVSTSSEDERT